MRKKIICECFSVFPKTDYTYSPTSQCRYEIAPGILAMPNMSRRPIHANNGSTVSQTSHRNLSQASQGTTESGISDMDTVDLKETISQIHSVSICHLELLFSYFSCIMTLRFKTIREFYSLGIIVTCHARICRFLQQKRLCTRRHT